MLTLVDIIIKILERKSVSKSLIFYGIFFAVKVLILFSLKKESRKLNQSV